MKFAVLSLSDMLLAFRFSGAVMCCDTHREPLAQEASGASQANAKLDLAPPARHGKLWTRGRLHVQARRDAYQAAIHPPAEEPAFVCVAPLVRPGIGPA